MTPLKTKDGILIIEMPSLEHLIIRKNKMRTSNAKLLNEIDILENTMDIEAKDLEVVKLIEELEGNQAQAGFFIVTNKTMTLNFREKANAEKFLSKQSAATGMKLICTGFAD